MQKPFQTYFGGKESPGTYQTIINHIRPHKYFIEAFGGNYTISRKLNCDSVRLINEIDDATYLRYPKPNEKFKFYNHDYRKFLNRTIHPYLTENAVLYLDAPYLFESRKSGRPVYNKEFGSTGEHTELLTLANNYKNVCDILISHYPHPLYFEMLEGWSYTEFESTTRNGKAIEGLWYNYEVDRLADYSYLGTDRIDRQRIKRRVRLLKEKLSNLPELERLAVLDGLKKKFPQL